MMIDAGQFLPEINGP